MNTLANAIKRTTNMTKTANGALSLASTGNALVDAFQRVPASRANPSEGLKYWIKAYREDYVAAVALAFYVRDVRGGQKEKGVFKEILRWLFKEDIEVFNAIVKLVPEYGYWKDLIEFDSEAVADLITKQLASDLDSEKCSLLAKWMPSINASSKATRTMGRGWANALGLSEKQYRKMLSHLRAKIGIVESKISEGNWSEVDYGSVPSVANKNLSNAFLKHDGQRRKEFLSSVMRGEKKVKAGTLQPHELVHALRSKKIDATSAEAIWKSLPDFTNGENAIVMADVSGSMTSGFKAGGAQPIDASIALAGYFAQRNTGAFKNLAITFSSAPKFLEVGDTLQDVVDLFSRHDLMIGYSTDLQAAFNLLLRTAVKNKVPKGEMPTKLYVVSDMEFNVADSDRLMQLAFCRMNGDAVAHREKTNFEAMKDKFNNAGYDMPVIVFWRLNSIENQFPASASDENVVLIGGLSSDTFELVAKAIAKDEEKVTPESIMVNILTSERYAPVFDALAGR